METTVRTVCQACHAECGVIAHVKDGKVTRIVGDPNHPMNRGFICVKGRSEPERLYHPDRLKYPLRRAGERGGGKWERVSWDTALDGIAEKTDGGKRKVWTRGHSHHPRHRAEVLHKRHPASACIGQPEQNKRRSPYLSGPVSGSRIFYTGRCHHDGGRT